MVSGTRALCSHAANLESIELKRTGWSPHFVFAVEACLLDIYRILRPQPCDYEQRAVLVRVFNLMAKDTFGNNGDFPVVEAFGSFTMDLFTAESDLDLSINFSDGSAAEFPRDKKISVLKKFNRFLYTIQRQGHISTILPVLRARVPVVKVVDSGTGIECDISVENKDGISRSSILTIVSSIDERFQMLSYLMKAWAKAYDINSSKDQTMNSLSIISLVAFHLQTRDPPIMPPFSVLLKGGTDLPSLQRTVSKFKHFGRRNEEPIAKLFISLLVKLSAIEDLWSQGLCVSIFEGSWIKKEWKNGIANMSIEDFLDRSENFARSVDKAGKVKIYNSIQDSLSLLSDLMKRDTGEAILKERLIRFFDLQFRYDQLIGERMRLNRPVPFHETDVNSLVPGKRARYAETIEEPFTAKRARFAEATQEPLPTRWPGLSIHTYAPSSFRPSHAQSSYEAEHHNSSRHENYQLNQNSQFLGFLGDRQENPWHGHSARIEHHRGPLPLPRFSAPYERYQPDRNSQFPGIMGGGQEIPWRGYSPRI